MPSEPSLFQASSYLQRRTEERLDPGWVNAAQADPDTRYLLARGTALLVRDGPETRIAFVGPECTAGLRLDASRLILLGWFRQHRCVLVELPSEAPMQPAGTAYQELRPLLAQLPEEEAHLLAYARAMLVWRARHRHCGVCGALTAPRSAGHVLVCSSRSCGAEFFPRIDPAIIVLVTDGTRALLGRQQSWPRGRYSALAGFVEAGESLEDAVAREVSEETGVQVHSLRYFASQPWPFPASLMLGFHAQAPQGEIILNGELEEARWFELEQLRAAPTALLPPVHTIARRLIEAWFEMQTREQRPSA